MGAGSQTWQCCPRGAGFSAERWKREGVWLPPPQFQRVTERQAEWGRAIFARRPLEFALWNWESEAWSRWRLHRVEDARAMSYLPRRAPYRECNQSGGLSLAASKLDGKSHLSTLKPESKTPNLELWDLLFSLLGPGLSLVHYFFTMPLCLSLQMAMYNLYHCRLKVCFLSFGREVRLRDRLNSQKKHWV